SGPRVVVSVVAQINHAVLRVVRMQDNVAETALAGIGHCRDARDVADRARAEREQLELAPALRHEHTLAVGQKFHRPRLVEVVDGRDVERIVRVRLRGLCGAAETAETAAARAAAAGSARTARGAAGAAGAEAAAAALAWALRRGTVRQRESEGK